MLQFLLEFDSFFFWDVLVFRIRNTTHLFLSRRFQKLYFEHDELQLERWNICDESGGR